MTCAVAVVFLLGHGAARANPLTIGETEVQPGERKDITLVVSQSYSGTTVKVPLSVVRGEGPGPTLCLIAGVHGDELNGVGVVRQLLEDLKPEDIRGTVIGIPIVNLLGFWAQSRYLPDRRDLNRYFPGSPRGSTASRIAHKMWTDVLRHCSYAIDYHTGSLHRSNLPQVRGDLSRREVMRLAHGFGARVLVHNRGQRGTMRRALTDSNIPTILFESGEAMRFQPEHVAEGVAGTWRVMQLLGMRQSNLEPQQTQVFLETHWVRAEHGGILELIVPVGADVNAGDLLGVITDPLNNRRKELRSKWTGHIIGKAMAPTVLPGLAVVHIGVRNGRMRQSEAETAEIEEERPE